MDKKLILDQYAFQRHYLSLLVDDIPDDQMCAQPGGVVNHPAWHLGHLSYTTDQFNLALGGASSLDPSWKDLFAFGTNPNPHRANYPSKSELIRVLDERRNVLTQAISRATPDDLAKAIADPKVAAIFPTVGRLILFGMMFHEGTHLGQLACWRKAAGFPLALSKLVVPKA